MKDTATEISPGVEAKLIAEQNDKFRCALAPVEGINGTVVMTKTVHEQTEIPLLEIMEAVKNYSNFTPANDPYGERTMGFFDINGSPFIWKIDLYDNNYKFGSPKPSDITVTARVLTIMTARDY